MSALRAGADAVLDEAKHPTAASRLLPQNMAKVDVDQGLRG